VRFKGPKFRQTRAIKLQLTQLGRVASGMQMGLKIQSDSAPPPFKLQQTHLQIDHSLVQFPYLGLEVSLGS
jgi:hypothetical protein